MKNFNLISRLLSYSHEKQTPQRFGRYAAMLIMLLTLGVGQMWADWSFSGSNYFYFVNKGGWSDSNIQLVVGKGTSSGYTSCYNSPTTLTGTKLIVKQGPSSGWTDANFIGFMGNGSNWGSGDWGRDNITNNATHCALYTSGVSASNNQCYAIIPPDNETGKTTSATLEYLGSGYASLNKSQTVNVKVTTDGGSTYSAPAKSPARIDFSSKAMSSFTGVGNSTGNFAANGTTVTLSKNAAYTATTTLTYSSKLDDYTFVCWHDGSSSVGTGTTYTYYPTSAQTITARFTKNFTAGDVLYLLVNSTWKNASGLKRYVAYFYGAGGNTWASCTQVGTSDYYSVTVPPGNWGYVIFVASNSNDSYGWDYKIYQTDDLMYDSSHNGVEITGSNNSQSRITVYTGISVSRTPSAAASAPTITNTQTVVKAGNSVTINAQSENTGYHWVNWTKTSGTLGNASNKSTTFTPSANSASAVANYALNTYTVTYNANDAQYPGTASGSTTSSSHTYGTAKALTSNGFTRTGYNFAGWATSPTGDVAYTDGESVTNLTTKNGATVPLYAKWTAKQSAITFDYQTSITGYYSSGDITNADGLKGTYNSAMTALEGTMPSAIAGYAFTGFYDATSDGTKYYNADGTSAHTWDKDTESGTTLYARWEKAQITALTLDAAVVETNGTVGVTPTISPKPTGDTKLCFYVFHSNDNPLSPQPSISWNGTKATFSAGETSGTYKIGVALRTGTECGGGEKLDSTTVSYQVAGIHDVTVRYKCGDDVIASSTTATGRPLDWTEVVAHEIFGYTFSSWTAGDGVTLRDTTPARLAELQAEDPTIVAVTQMKAIYDGYMTANYTQNGIIYFKDNLGWTDPEDENAHIYVNFLLSNYWGSGDDSGKGSGNENQTNRNIEMSRVPGTTNIFYYDYGAASITPSNYVSFTKESFANSKYFWVESPGFAHVVYPSMSSDALGTDKATSLGFYSKTPMFVPQPIDEDKGKSQNNGRARYYNDGYWTKFTPGTGYTLQVYYSDGSTKKADVVFTSEDDLMPMKAKLDLEAGQTYKFQIKRDGDVYYTNGNNTMTYANHGQGTAWEFTTPSPFNMTSITTNAAGDYTFNLSYSPNASNEYRLRIAVDYPIKSGDYRLVYKDNVQTKEIKSAIVTKVNNGKDTVSFFVRPGSTPVLKIQQSTINESTGAITWGSDAVITSSLSELTKDSVYNICLAMNGSGAISVENVKAYEGNFYIRTDAANSKWDNYRSDPDHLMTYSEYSINHGGYSHYYMHWVDASDSRKNVKFCIANDYSPNISDTLIRETASGDWANINNYIESNGDLKRNANVRFMWNRHDNTISRAYVDGAQDEGSRFLVISSTDGKIKKADGSALSNNEVTFSDDENWIYEANVKAQSGAQIKLKSIWGESNTIEQYFKGSSSATEALIGGSGENWYDIRILYDFKTNRLIASYIPVDENIEDDKVLEADIMFIREHQGDIAQLTFGESGKISKIETAYGVMRFNKWTLANKDKSTHTPLGSPASIYERSLYWISFPFKVKLSEVIGFGTYGVHWAIQRYDGKDRAERGHFLENGSFWKWMNRNTDYLEPDQGYLLAIDLDLLGESSDVWGPESRSDQIELYFPSYGTMPDITNANVEQTIDAHACTINRAATEGLPDTGDPRTSYNRTIFDSHWNVMSVPTYVNTDDVSFTNDTWIAEVGPNFLYTWNADDNTITATSASGYTYHAMHAYMVQYGGDITWSASSGSPASIVARRTYAEKPSKVEFRLELQQNEKMIDRTYVALSNDEEVSTGFKFGEDLTKEFNANKSSVYTFIADEATVAGNTLPMSNQTTIVPVGVDIKKNGDYTFSIPDGTSGIGVTLIDNETGIRTSLSAIDYTVALTAGDYVDRFVLEISPIKETPTGIEQSPMTNDQSQIKKVMIDGILYIVKDGKMYDARGNQVK